MADYFTTRAKVPNIPKGQFSTVMRPFTAAQAAQKRWGFKDFDPVPGLPSGRGTFMPVGYTQTPPPAASIESEWATPELLKDFLIMMEGTRKPIAPEEVFKGLIGPTGGPLLAGVAKAGIKGSVDPSTLRVNVFHGGPHKWAAEPKFPQGRPRLDKIGTGEGAQAYGHGFYSAEAPGVALDYKRVLSGDWSDKTRVANAMYDALNPLPDGDVLFKGNKYNKDDFISEAVKSFDKPDWWNNIPPGLRIATEKRLEGHVYKLDIPDKDIAKYLDYDAPLSKQPKGVREKLEKANLLDTFKYGLDPEWKDTVPIKDMVNFSDAGATEALRKAGIPGLKYYDQMSRGKSGGNLIDVFQDNGKWFSKIKVSNRDGTDYFTTSMPFDSKDLAESWARKEIGSGTRNYVTWDQRVLNRAKILDE